jgi:uncharacterized protein (DUF362 family)
MNSAHIQTRRSLLAATGALAAAGCGTTSPPQVKQKVSILRAPSYNADLLDTLRRGIAAHALDVKGKRVVLKPNLVEVDASVPINTHPVFVHAVAELFTSLGAASVRIAEGPGHRRNTWELAEVAGYFDAFPDFEQRFTDLNLDEVRRVPIPDPHSELSELYLGQTVLGCDLLVSLPKLKTHHWVGATLSMKNFFGLVPGGVYGWPKNVLHWAGIDASIADIHKLLPPHFAIVDGIEGMEGNGPIQGSPRHAGVIVMGSYLPAVDATCCRIMKIDPQRIGHLTLAAGAAGLAEEYITQAGETIPSVQTEFALLPVFDFLRLKATG